jgi:hypothetical protein
MRRHRTSRVRPGLAWDEIALVDNGDQRLLTLLGGGSGGGGRRLPGAWL